MHYECDLYFQNEDAVAPSIIQLGRVKGYTQRWETSSQISHSLFDISVSDKHSYAIK